MPVHGCYIDDFPVDKLQVFFEDLDKIFIIDKFDSGNSRRVFGNGHRFFVRAKVPACHMRYMRG